MKQLLVVLALVVSCDPSELDEGWLVRDGFELRPVTLPWEMVGEPDMDVIVFREARDWWNTQGVGELFVGDLATEDRWLELWAAPEREFDGLVLVSVESIQSGDWDWDVDDHSPGGDAVLDYVDGLIVRCAVRVDWELAYDRPTATAILQHELGHCLGLADDPGSIDLHSCMGSPVTVGCRLTPGDRDRLLTRL